MNPVPRADPFRAQFGPTSGGTIKLDASGGAPGAPGAFAAFLAAPGNLTQKDDGAGKPENPATPAGSAARAVPAAEPAPKPTAGTPASMAGVAAGSAAAPERLGGEGSATPNPAPPANLQGDRADAETQSAPPPRRAVSRDEESAGIGIVFAAAGPDKTAAPLREDPPPARGSRDASAGTPSVADTPGFGGGMTGRGPARPAQLPDPPPTPAFTEAFAETASGAGEAPGRQPEPWTRVPVGGLAAPTAIDPSRPLAGSDPVVPPVFRADGADDRVAPALPGLIPAPDATTVADWSDRDIEDPVMPGTAAPGDAPRDGGAKGVLSSDSAAGQGADIVAKAVPVQSVAWTSPPRPETAEAPVEPEVDAAADAGGTPGFGFDPATARPGERAQTPAQIAQLPAGFGHRLAEAIAASPDRQIEVTLSPAELGRVRMTLSTHGGALTLAILADRPDTIDLMRRHIDQLAQDFRDLGFADVSFSFGHRENTHRGHREAEPNLAANTVPGAAPAVGGSLPAPSALRPDADGGLDLRL